jgi:zinc/manganese transport system permease protein
VSSPLGYLQEMWSYPFMVNAFRGGTVIALVAAAVGWFVVLRRESFAAHTLAIVGFPGAAAAGLLGVGPVLGYFAACLTASIVLGAAGRPGHASARLSAVLVGVVQAMALGAGYLFTTLSHQHVTGLTSLLFGSFLGITEAHVVALALVGAGVLLVLVVLGRPLFFASVDPTLARARHVPMRLLSLAFLVTVGATTAAATQLTGALLVFALLVMPAATVQLLTARPWWGLVATATLSLGITWLALSVAFSSPYPVGFFLTSFAFAAYLLARLAVAIRPRGAR